MTPIRATAAAAAAVLTAALAGCGSDAEDAEDLGGSWTASLHVTRPWSGDYVDGHGTVDISSSDGTSVQLSVGGLGDSVDYTAHVHDGECDEDPPGGGHWLADPEGADAAGNIVELSFTTSETGTGETTVSVPVVLDDRAESVVVHAPEALTETEGLDSDRVLCGDLEDD
ncbi:hypothetical protein [Glycomyces harbinensis]|uniref:Superoxide dismutase, Cu-Zn family n=1 Tax=Glycomyces harbinensis TaxID=58114 RepID=A0A1G6STJ3_9ACTN|nr:hypothetical protein [Glycomyces harbinensis]SDD20172.1 hypothetical protein SAMN05216270_102286 [Glycomyces harbinensis]